MSLVSLAVRHVAQRLLAGNTWAGGNVFDSPIDPLETWGFETGDIQPRISLYTTERDLETHGRQTQGKQTKLSLAFNIMVPPKVIIEREGGEVDIEFDTRLAGGGKILDLLGRQIERAIHFGDPTWVEIWNIFVTKIDGVKSKPLVYRIGDDVEIPVISNVYELTCSPEPAFGESALTQGWVKLLDAMKADPKSEPDARLIEELIASLEGLLNWEQARHQMGWTVEEARVAGIAPADPTTTDDAAILTEITTSEPEDE